MILNLQNINTGYGKKQVLFDISLEIKAGESILLVGSNGSGKSTLFKAIYGLLPLWKDAEGQKGQLFYQGKEISNLASHQLIKEGLMYIPQKNELFEDMTVEQNLKLSTVYLNDNKESKKRTEEVFEKIDLLKDKKKQTVNELSGGERKLLSLGMVLANRPKLLLYDEPLAGLSVKNAKIVLNWLKKIQDNKITFVIIEHRIKEIFSFATQIIGLKLGYLHNNSLNNIQDIKTFLV